MAGQIGLAGLGAVATVPKPRLRRATVARDRENTVTS